MNTLDRHEWTARCSRRLAELRPDVPLAHLAHVALDLWLSDASDPATAAECEVRGWPAAQPGWHAIRNGRSVHQVAPQRR